MDRTGQVPEATSRIALLPPCIALLLLMPATMSRRAISLRLCCFMPILQEDARCGLFQRSLLLHFPLVGGKVQVKVARLRSFTVFALFEQGFLVDLVLSFPRLPHVGKKCGSG